MLIRIGIYGSADKKPCGNKMKLCSVDNLVTNILDSREGGVMDKIKNLSLTTFDQEKEGLDEKIIAVGNRAMGKSLPLYRATDIDHRINSMKVQTGSH